MKEGFSELYARLYNENVNELEALRVKAKKAATKTVLFIILLFASFILLPFLAPIIVIGVIVVCISKGAKGKVSQSMKDTNEYKQLFKEKIVTPLIENVFEGSSYNPEKGWSRLEYMSAGYKDDIDRYSSEDMITAPIMVEGSIETVMQFAEVHTERESRDKDGHRSYHTQFYGLAGRMPLKKDIASKIYIRTNGASGIFNKNKIKMDMSEFEKIFDVESQDKILAVRILTSDVMSEMIDLYKKFKYRFEIHIINKTIYIRIATGEVFEPNVFQNAMEYKTVEAYYLILQAVMKISKHIYDTINEIEI